MKVQKGESAFDMKKPWGEMKDDDAELEHPTVYFTITILTDEEPEEVTEGICAKWSRCNDKKMYRKNLGCFKTCTPVIFFHVLNTASKSTMIAETRDILHLANEIVDADGMSDAYVYLNLKIPEISIQVSVLKNPRTRYNHLSRMEQPQAMVQEVYAPGMRDNRQGND